MRGNLLIVRLCENVLKDLGGLGQELVGRWSVDPTDTDIVMSLGYDAGDVDYNAALGYRFWQWLSRLCGSGNTNQGSVFDDRTSRRPK